MEREKQRLLSEGKQLDPPAHRKIQQQQISFSNDDDGQRLESISTLLALIVCANSKFSRLIVMTRFVSAINKSLVGGAEKRRKIIEKHKRDTMMIPKNHRREADVAKAKKWRQLEKLRFEVRGS